MSTVTPVDALLLAIQKAGGQSALAARLKGDDGMPITGAAISNWLRRGTPTPAQHCPGIEAFTGVACEELRPDVDWAVLRGKRRKPAREAA